LQNKELDCPQKPKHLKDPAVIADKSVDATSRDVDPKSKFWLWLVIGILIPPIGLVALLIYLAQQLTAGNRQQA
jgi:hypothetical protein